MAKSYKKVIVAILFADAKGFSQLPDEATTKFNDLLLDFHKRFLTEDNHFLWKTWGDGILVAAYDPVDLADIALDLRDYFKNMNWPRRGFSEPLGIRIGCHVERTNIEFLDGVETNIHGTSVNSTARIEPIVEPGRVFCSETFAQHVETALANHYVFEDLGSMDLAKGFGEMHLFEMLRQGDSPSSAITPQADSSVKVPRVPKEFSDLERDDFIRHAFAGIKTYFERAGKALENSDDTVNFKVDDYSDRVNYRIYVKRKKVANCSIWIASDHGTEIRYLASEGFGNSYNMAFNVVDDGYELLMHSYIDFSGGEKNLNIEALGERVWKEFVSQLDHR